MAQKQDVVDSPSQKTKIVGDKDCKTSTIVLAIYADDGALVAIEENWKILAQNLGIRQSEIMKLTKDIRLGIIDIPDVVTDILHKWVSQRAKEATLKNLIDAAKDLKMGKVVSILENIQFGDLR